MTTDYQPQCDYCDDFAITKVVNEHLLLDEDDEETVCKRHAGYARKHPDMVTAKWTGTYWQAV